MRLRVTDGMDIASVVMTDRSILAAAESRRGAREIRQQYGQWRYTLAGRQEWTLVERLFAQQETQLASGTR
jgi:hypothetical protein